MTNMLQNRESTLEKKLQSIELTEKCKAGVLLRVIPNRANWESFLAIVKKELSL
jgi:hypothetical protein